MQTVHLPATSGLKAATVVRWLVQPGQSLRPGQAMVVLETESALVEVECPAEGVLAEVLAEAGRTLPAGAALARLATGLSPDEPKVVATAAPKPGQPGEVRTPVTQKPEASPSSTPAGVVPILMPQAGNTMEEGTIVSWKVKEGDRIAVGQVIMEIETDKATVEVEATDAGRIARIVAKEGDVVPVKTPVAYLSEGEVSGAPAPAANAASAPPAPSPAAATTPAAPAAQPPRPVGTGKAIPILMPQAGNTMEEGTIVAWKVKEGDRITAGQVIMEVETDKATVEVEATDAGRVARIVAREGDVVPVKTPVAYLAESDADLAELPTGGATSGPADEARPAAGTSVAAASSAPLVPAGKRVAASPAARRLAKERGVDLASVGTGSGPGGRVLSTDLDRARPAATAAAAPVAGDGKPIRRPMSKMRKAIAANLQASKQTVPHFYVRLTIDADPLLAYYRQQKPATGCTINDVITLAVGRTIGRPEFRGFRSRIDGNDLVEFPTANIGLAVGVEEGLVVPVIVGVDRMTLAQLAPEAKRVVEAARKGKIENLGRGVFTLSNLGMFGVEEFAAIINPPESGILAISAAREQVIVKDGAMRPGRVMTLTLSADHRVVDGVLAAQFMAKLREVLESPQQLAHE